MKFFRFVYFLISPSNWTKTHEELSVIVFYCCLFSVSRVFNEINLKRNSLVYKIIKCFQIVWNAQICEVLTIFVVVMNRRGNVS